MGHSRYPPPGVGEFTHTCPEQWDYIPCWEMARSRVPTLGERPPRGERHAARQRQGSAQYLCARNNTLGGKSLRLRAIRAMGTDRVPLSPRQPGIWIREAGAGALQGCHPGRGAACGDGASPCPCPAPPARTAFWRGLGAVVTAGLGALQGHLWVCCDGVLINNIRPVPCPQEGEAAWMHTDGKNSSGAQHSYQAAPAPAGDQHCSPSDIGLPSSLNAMR